MSCCSDNFFFCISFLTIDNINMKTTTFLPKDTKNSFICATVPGVDPSFEVRGGVIIGEGSAEHLGP